MAVWQDSYVARLGLAYPGIRHRSPTRVLWIHVIGTAFLRLRNRANVKPHLLPNNFTSGRHNRRKAKAKSRRQILNVGGVLSVRDANKRIDARRAEEIKKKWRIEERARKRRIRQAKETASRIAQNNDMCAIIDAQISGWNQPDENPFFYLDTNPSSA
ncbi:hypothetical protein EYB25_008684 [Talaromyces marneffei]|nr:hypothetical protein EYB25_008684 [Talaromyces marneffei]